MTTHETIAIVLYSFIAFFTGGTFVLTLFRGWVDWHSLQERRRANELKERQIAGLVK